MLIFKKIGASNIQVRGPELFSKMVILDMWAYLANLMM